MNTSLSPQSVLEFLRGRLGASAHGVGEDTPLLSSGILDSFAMVELIAYVESHCQTRFTAGDINLDNLDTVNRLIDFVSRTPA